ncbi:NUDIX domain-containing protein [Patescibacteria group bacterium]|nr:NUDIX domain-containing protein [Patescibacteria group bacterium]
MRPLVGVGVMIKNKDGQVLLGLRKSPHGQGTWSFPGGHLEFGETMETAIIREAKEETGLDISELELVSLADEMGSLEQGKHYVNVGFLANTVSGEAKIMEPEKCEEWQWFNLEKLPEPIFEGTALMIKNYLSKKIYQNKI